ncbi:hypothetical protein [Leptothrix discophora]|uniref:Uncharacterized protein n=1 Tax=Leptothrix discophora TaxID=89 RepID=A0ABT9FZG8_LEPDI|nr:hypothetical protein [Leptothrix discophora]MDP4299615.1 hypothetical protein [Leptothrix discophora]
MTATAHLAEIPAAFRREQGCSVAEWLAWLPGAIGGRTWRRVGEHGAEVALDPDMPAAVLRLDWETLPPRQIALLRMPRLAVTFAFEGCSADERARFMRYFDLYTRRGGG